MYKAPSSVPEIHKIKANKPILKEKTREAIKNKILKIEKSMQIKMRANCYQREPSEWGRKNSNNW